MRYPPYAAFDIEAQQLIDRNVSLGDLGFAVGCAWKNPRRELGVFWSPEELVTQLEKAPIVVSFNGERFDIPLLAELIGRPLKIKRSVDLFRIVEENTGRMIGLDALARANIDRGKTGKGADAPELWKQGRTPELARYCQDDVELLRDLYEYMLDWEGFVSPWSGEFKKIDKRLLWGGR